MTQEIAPRGTRQVEGFGTREVARQEMGLAAAQAQAQAAVQARYIMAMRNPRNAEIVEQELMIECKRPEFALQARHAKPVGGGQVAEGWFTRLEEAWLRIAGNIEWTSQAIHEDDRSVTWEFGVHDLQANIHITEQATFAKTVERKFANGREVISKRQNSKGEAVYLVKATEDELNNRVKAARSKAWRSTTRLIRGDSLDACEAEVAATIAALPPRKKIELLLKGFDQVGVKPIDIQQFLGHPIKRKVGQQEEYALSAEEIEELISIGAAIRAKEITWAQVMADRNPEGTKEQAEAIAASKIEALKQAADAAQGIAPEPKQEAAPADGDAEMKAFDAQQAKEQSKKGKLSL